MKHRENERQVDSSGNICYFVSAPMASRHQVSFHFPIAGRPLFISHFIFIWPIAKRFVFINDQQRDMVHFLEFLFLTLRTPLGFLYFITRSHSSLSPRLCKITCLPFRKSQLVGRSFLEAICIRITASTRTRRCEEYINFHNYIHGIWDFSLIQEEWWSSEWEGLKGRFGTIILLLTDYDRVRRS